MESVRCVNDEEETQRNGGGYLQTRKQISSVCVCVHGRVCVSVCVVGSFLACFFQALCKNVCK